MPLKNSGTILNAWVRDVLPGYCILRALLLRDFTCTDSGPMQSPSQFIVWFEGSFFGKHWNIAPSDLPIFFTSFFFFVISPAYTPGISGPICPSQLKVFLLEYIGKEPLPIFTSFFFFVISPVAQCPSQLIVWFEHCIGIAPLLIFQSSIFYASFFFVISPAQAANHCPSQLSGHNAESDWRPRPPLEYIGMALTKFLLQI